jgi:hypothetical protein
MKTKRKPAKITSRKSWKRLAAIIVVILLPLSIGGWLGYGYYQEKVVKPNSPIAIVNGEKITTQSYLQTFEYRRYLLFKQLYSLQDEKEAATSNEQISSLENQIGQVQSEMMGLTFQLLEDMIGDALIKQEVKKRGHVFTAGEIDVHAREMCLQDIGTTGRPEDVSKTVFNGYLEEIGISARGHRQIAEAELYRQKLRTLLEDDEALNSWLTQARESSEIKRYLSSDKLPWWD